MEHGSCALKVLLYCVLQQRRLKRWACSLCRNAGRCDALRDVGATFLIKYLSNEYVVVTGVERLINNKKCYSYPGCCYVVYAVHCTLKVYDMYLS